MTTPTTSLDALYSLVSLLRNPTMVDMVVTRYKTWEELAQADPGDRVYRLGPWAAQTTFPARPLALPDFGPGVETSTRYDRTYPQRLSDLHSAPVILYRRNRFPQGPYVAIGGSFYPSKFGLEVSIAAARAAVQSGKNVVAAIDGGSGQAAIEAALKAGGKVLAVASGDLKAPSQHTELVGQILENGGSIMTEWGPGEPWTENNTFSALRLVAAMGTAVVISELGTHPAGGAELAKAAISTGRFLIVPQPPVEELIGPAYLGTAVLARAKNFSSKTFGSHPRMLARVAAGESPADAVVATEEDIIKSYEKAFS